MKNSELFDFIRGFSEEEIKDFDNFLQSPYFVKGTSLNKVLKEIVRNRNLLLDSDYKRINEKLIKKLKYSKLTLTKQLSYLAKALTKFLKIKSAERDTIASELNLNEYFLKKKYFSALKNNLKKPKD